jgi:dynein heavy chain
MNFPLDGEIFDYFIDFHSKRLKPWTNIVPVYHYDPEAMYSKIFVPTPDSTKFSNLLGLLNNDNCNPFIIGESGIGKTQIIMNYLNGLNKDKFLYKTITF